ncbi:hypothetical protein Hdeb2414_s0015g00445791 [Helianthus debilis subsp. tardiflorus]
MIYVDRTICGYINSVRTTSPLSFWTKDMLSIREKYEIKNGGFGKGSLREGYMEDRVSDKVSFKGDESVAYVTDVKGVGVDVYVRDTDRGVDGKGSVKSADIGKFQPMSFEEHVLMVESLMAETLRKKELLNKELNDIWYKYPKKMRRLKSW